MPDVFNEAELLLNLQTNEWHLLTTENAACVLQLGEFDDERFANVLLLGGKKNGSLREIMRAHLVFCDFCKTLGITKITGQPRKEFHRFLLRNGFKQKQEDFEKELN
ncbi:hypothetical protein [Pararhizobium qamdonense]|uniref:hypothetical protein n=1 Tax=Pararhizobium qamdonense TaxID=3031126 RepID=UPI0023E1DAAD|nr:hypothetical protein [Pararhizobium qamdonense]